ERSPTRLADAIEALRLLGRDTHAARIAERVLKLARFVDFEPDLGGNNRPSIFNEVFKLFDNLPANIVQRACANELRIGTARSRKFLINHAHLMRIESPIADELLAAMCEACQDRDPEIRRVAVGNMQWLAGGPDNSNQAQARLLSLHVALRDQSAAVAMTAAEQLRDVESASKAVAGALARIVAKPDSVDQRMNALNHLAVMGPRAASVASQVAAVLLEPTSDDEIPIDPQFVGWLRPYRSARPNPFQFVAVVALARMGKAAVAELPKIDKVLEVASENSIGRSSITLDDHLQWPELLVAAKTRIQPPPALDLRGGELMMIDGALLYLAMERKLLQIEEALLKQLRDVKHPSVSELANQASITGGAFALVKQEKDMRQLFRNAAMGLTPTTDAVAKSYSEYLAKHDALGETLPMLPNGLSILAVTYREAIIDELGKLGPAAREALPVLKKELESKNKSVTAAAEKAIKLIEAAKDDQKAE
ncbi:MAG: hypothetical protein IAG10_25750, partial [Planctomycetaceae bacterium]|nr:hypothetical protein [Planctomycetaceae bacterium]